MIINKYSLGKLITVFFCLHIVLSAYEVFGSISIGDMIMLVLSVITLVLARRFSKVEILPALWIYITLQTMMLILLSKPYATPMPTMNKFIRLCLMYFIVFVIVDVIDVKLLYKTHWIVSACAIVLVFFQALQIWVLKTDMTIFIPFYEHAAKDQTILLMSKRPSAFFLEPQHLCSFILPLLLIEIRKQDYVKAGILTFTILLSTSTQGVVCAGVVWIFFLVFDDKRRLRSKIFMSVVIVAFVAAFIYTDLFTGAIDKIQSGAFENNIRIYRALDVFKAMPVKDKLIGIGMKDVNNYLAYSGVCNRWLMSDASPAHNYISSLIGNFIEFGVVGGILYIVLLVRMFISSNKAGKGLVVLIAVSAFSMTITYNVWFVFYIVLFYMINTDEKIEKMKWGKS